MAWRKRLKIEGSENLGKGHCQQYGNSRKLEKILGRHSV